MQKNTCFLTLALVIQLILNCFAQEAKADNCSTGSGPVTLGPCSTAGEFAWNSGNTTLYFCNGSDKISMSSSGNLGSCAGNAASTLEYDTSNSIYKFCDGSNWIPFANNGTLGSCSSALAINYNSTNSVLTWCDGSNWISITETGSAETGKCVFRYYSASLSGNMGGVSGADSKCQSSADSAGLGGTYKAWISAKSGGTNWNPAADFTQSTTPYILPNGEKVADNWTDLTDGTIQTAIDITAYGTSNITMAFTNTDTDGTLVDGNNDCSEWTSDSGDYGSYGSGSATSSSWTASASSPSCTTGNSLLCFEQ